MCKLFISVITKTIDKTLGKKVQDSSHTISSNKDKNSLKCNMKYGSSLSSIWISKELSEPKSQRDY